MSKSKATLTLRDFCRLILLAAVLAPVAGCTSVAPYERGTLARRDMTLDGNTELSSAEGHATDVREGASGGFAGGGGCGCN